MTRKATHLVRSALVAQSAGVSELIRSAFCSLCGRRLAPDGSCQHGKSTISSLFGSDGRIGGVTIA